MFAGIASILLWDKDWSSLKNKGIYESLVEPKGIDAIDDFAMELMGFEDINYSTSKEAMRMKIIGQYSNAVAMKFTEKNLGKIEGYIYSIKYSGIPGPPPHTRTTKARQYSSYSMIFDLHCNTTTHDKGY